MIGQSRPIRSRLARIATVVCAAAVLVVTAYGPGDVASAFGLHRAPPGPAAMGYLPEPSPVVVKAPSARLVGLEKVATGQSIPLADGSMSPPVLYMRFRSIELDKLSITQKRNGAAFSIENTGTGNQAALVGNSKSTTEMWAAPNSLGLCVTAQTLNSVAIGYAGVFGGALDGLLRSITDLFAPIVASPLGPVGPCLPLVSLIPVLEVFVDYGVPLPETLPVVNLDVDVYSLKVSTPPGSPSLTIPKALVRVTR